MNIHEYQAKALLRSYGAALPQGAVAFTVEEAQEVAQTLKGPWVLKAQVHAGGRGKAGGIKIAKSLEDVTTFASELLGMTLVTPQTGEEGKVVQKIYIEEATPSSQEFYLSLLIDRKTSRLTFLASAEGGMDIEELAHSHPDKIIRTVVDPVAGFSAFQGRKLAYGLGLEGAKVSDFVCFAKNLYEAFTALDATLIEINPLVLTEEGRFMALDAKMSFDDNALYRHPDVAALRDLNEEDVHEYQASQHGISYIRLQGNIGCLVNGAGLAMATMDLLKLYGGAPANFLDVGGSAAQERVTEAFKIILSDVDVKGILVNIFGGIIQCDIIAQGIVAAVKEIGLSLPLVVRLQGTHSEEGKEIFRQSKLPIIAEESFESAAQRIVKEVG